MLEKVDSTRSIYSIEYEYSMFPLYSDRYWSIIFAERSPSTFTTCLFESDFRNGFFET